MPIAQRLREFSRWHVENRLLSLRVRPDAGVETIDVANTLLPRDVIRPGWICYCAGVGEEIGLEQTLAGRFGAEVWAFDPTPRSIEFMRRTPHDAAHLRFVPVGLWNEDTTLRFHAPADPSHVSHSVMGGQGGGAFFDAPCRSLSSMMRELGHDHIDLLKMNIEGAEHVVLESMLDEKIRPTVITLTWEGDGAMSKAVEWTARLRHEGWSFVGRRSWFFTYLRRE